MQEQVRTAGDAEDAEDTERAQKNSQQNAGACRQIFGRPFAPPRFLCALRGSPVFCERLPAVAFSEARSYLVTNDPLGP